MTIQDFGEKIGGAKKDIWKARGLIASDLMAMNAAEKDKFIKKDNVWKKPDYEALVDQGLPVRVVYFMKLMRDSLPAKPVFSYTDKTPELREARQKGYVSFVSQMKDAVMGLKTEEEVRNFYKTTIDPYLIRTPHSSYVSLKPEAHNCINNKLLRHAHYAETSFYYIDRDIKKKMFCYSQEEKILSAYSFYHYDKDSVSFTKDYTGRDMMEISIPNGMLYLYPPEQDMDPSIWENNTYFALLGRKIVGRNYASMEAAKNAVLTAEMEAMKDNGKERSANTSRKKKFIPKQLANIFRQGDDFRKDANVTGNDYLDVFHFKGGEYGNWMSDKDRQASLNYGFDALIDLSKALQIDPADISLGNRLSIAFGARGSGSALAHYEPLREVINLTKMRGAGSLAHEWGHALDDIIGKELGIGGFMTERIRNPNTPESLLLLMDAMKYKPDSAETITSSTGITYHSRRAETDFYKQSKAFDSQHAKTDNGYWQSNVELFARAFACYVTDKISAMDGRSDYLSGHSEAAMSIGTDKNGNTTIIRAFPYGEEREYINTCFDEFIKDLKSREILHHKEIDADFFRKPKSTKEKPSLDDLLRSAQNEKDEQSKRSVPVKTKERNDGQLEFELW